MVGTKMLAEIVTSHLRNEAYKGGNPPWPWGSSDPTHFLQKKNDLKKFCGIRLTHHIGI